MSDISMRPFHLFFDLSAHGLGQLAQLAPILEALVARLPSAIFTLRSALPEAKIRARVRVPFAYLAGASDFGFVMHDALRIDFAATACAYRAQHQNWARRVADEAEFLARLKPDLVVSCVAYLPLAGAAQAKIPSFALGSLNWADLFAHFFGGQTWAKPIELEMHRAYAEAEAFLRLTPGMAMPHFSHSRAIAPVAALGQNRRAELLRKTASGVDTKFILLAFGGFDKALPSENWPQLPSVHWLFTDTSMPVRDDMSRMCFDRDGFSFSDLLCSADAVLTKPGYGTFTEAACNGTAVLYLRRDNWPEQECLIDWLNEHARSQEVSEKILRSGDWSTSLDVLWKTPRPPIPKPSGAQEAAAIFADYLNDAAEKKVAALQSEIKKATLKSGLSL